MRDGKRPGWEEGAYELMRERLKTARGRTLYALRKISVEPVFGQIKHNRRVDRFMRRGRAAAQSELRLVTATHNLLKLHNHWIANTAESEPLTVRGGEPDQTRHHAEPRSLRIFQRPRDGAGATDCQPRPIRGT